MTTDRAQAPLVSVILPTFNRAATLARAMRSVLEQSYGPLELVVVDDGSSDDTADVFKRCADSRARLVRSAERRGPGAARNAGVAASGGPLVAFQDSDDEWLPEKLAKQVAHLRSAGPEFGIDICRYREHASGKTTEFTHPDSAASGNPLPALLAGINFITPTWLVRRDLLERAGGFDESLPSCEDYDLAFRLHDLCRFAFLDEVLVSKFSTPDSVYNHADTRAQGRRKALERHRRRWRDQAALLSQQERIVGTLLVRSGRRAQGARYVLQALLRDPVQQAAYAADWVRRRMAGKERIP